MQTFTRRESDRPSTDALPPRPRPEGEACLRRILLDLMLSPYSLPWPGADGLTVEEVLSAYVPASEEGRVPGQTDLIRWHPEFTREIRAFFSLAGVPTDCRDPQRVG